MPLRTALLLCATLLAAAAASAAETPPQPATPVIVAAVRTLPFTDPVEALGTLKARESVVVTANVTETVSAIHFDDGQRVKKGDILVEMTGAEEHALIEEGRARVAEAQRQYERVKSLAGQRSAAESLLDERRRDLETARAALAAIESRLADRLIKAPFDGVLGLRNISVGALVEPANQITTLDDLSTMKLDFSVPSVFLADLKPGLAVTARAPEYGDQRFRGEVSGVDSRIDPVTRSIAVRALIPNPDGRLRPGLLMQVELERNPRQALVIPESALLALGQDQFVMRVGADDRAERVQVRIGARRPGEVEITDGLRAGDRVITHGSDKVRAGQALDLVLDDGTRPLKDLLGAREAVKP
ncbi:efflux RND transporter periplasmic adaptor subunit [uncultured Lamprocystis sp.]|jgi:membrane fusion protein (multidrug efflux system)|uniref:efflux RND transporter periplasmic adaptor subunit n=1 Tax=uncultured Lamprocystis sp. TaxID=543132 RepID=UPI0025CE7415|nr:efflux RND transporter periplasmic adaptor subunit [uncultured Lamprocystis sp.]